MTKKILYRISRKDRIKIPTTKKQEILTWLKLTKKAVFCGQDIMFDLRASAGSVYPLLKELEKEGIIKRVEA